MLPLSLCSEMHVLQDGLAPAICWHRRSRLALGVVLCVRPPSGGRRRHLGGHQSPLVRPAAPSDLAPVVHDGSTQLARVLLARAIDPGFDQRVTASLRWNSTVDGLGLLLQQKDHTLDDSDNPKTTGLPFLLDILGL